MSVSGAVHPIVAVDRAEAVLAREYGIAADSIRRLSGYDDASFLVHHQGERSVLKIAASGTTERRISDLTALLEQVRMREPDVPISRVRRFSDGRHYGRSDLVEDRFVRLLTFLPGKPLADVSPKDEAVVRQVADALARIDVALRGFDLSSEPITREWNLSHFAQLRHVYETVSDVVDPDLRAEVERSLDWFDSTTADRSRLRKSTIHGDANDYNIFFDGFVDGSPRLSGIIDFGDSVVSELINESAIALAYLMMNRREPLNVIRPFVERYTAICPLEEAELASLFPLIRCRLSTTIIQAARQQRENPDNEYYQVSARPAFRLMRQLSGVPEGLAEGLARDAAGLEPFARAAHVRRLLSEANAAPILDRHFDASNCSVVDLSVEGLDGALVEDRADSGKEEATLLGRYNEVRSAYRSDQFLTIGDEVAERRTVHLGVDVFQPAGTPVRTPLDGVVYSVKDNSAALDYGPTVILRHELQGETFYSLFGHLSRSSTMDLQPGTRLSAGDVVATLGERSENGGWVPHLHYQLIVDLLGEEGNFPGVALPSRRSVYLSLCPSPDLLLRVPGGIEPSRRPDAKSTLVRRQSVLGRNLSVSYRRPLQIVGGEGVWLRDADGQLHLDCVNNVAHVGHGNTHVADAIARQSRILNTNTRYLHNGIVDYAERLLETLPDPLRVCYFVNSGSEANDLALRLARSFTRRHGVVALESGYHGNLSSLIEVSSYKFAGPGGFQPPEWMSVAQMPDPFRSSHGNDPRGHAAEVAASFEALLDRGQPAAAFLAETILSCGGQIVPPDGYLELAYEIARANGAVCIADEVQTGFGRVGSDFWAFQTQGVVPDIVTMGKPMGNGHPVGAVVTTREIAAAFDNGMEYFNTFGGNPVSMAAASAVLDVIEGEELQSNADVVGRYFSETLTELAGRHAIIGDVRGRGLFLGFEMIRTVEGREPAAEQASWLVNRLRRSGILLSTDGPLHNVIKIKPPMVFARRHVDQVVEKLDSALSEDFIAAMA